MIDDEKEVLENEELEEDQQEEVETDITEDKNLEKDDIEKDDIETDEDDDDEQESSDENEEVTPEVQAKRDRRKAERKAKKDRERADREELKRFRENELKANAELEALRASQSETPEMEVGDAPNVEQYEDTDAYQRDVALWAARKAQAEQLEATAKARKTARGKATDVQKVAVWQSRVEDFRQNKPDFDQKVYNDKNPVSENMMEALSSLSRGPEIAYHLAENPALAQRIYAMDQTQTTIELAEIGVRLGIPKAPETSKAPKPLKRIKSDVGSSKDPEKMSMEDYAKWRDQQEG